MASYAHAPGEACLPCPYNPNHRIRNSNFETHLAICRKRFRKLEAKAGRKCEMLVCKFNPSHRLLEPELKWHEEICSDAQTVVCCSDHLHCAQALKFLGLDMDTNGNGKGEFVEDPAGRVGKKKKDRTKSQIGPNAQNNLPPFCTEDWEQKALACQPGQDPKAKLNSKAFNYSPGGLVKSEKNTELAVPTRLEYKPYINDWQFHSSRPEPTEVADPYNITSFSASEDWELVSACQPGYQHKPTDVAYTNSNLATKVGPQQPSNRLL